MIPLFPVVYVPYIPEIRSNQSVYTLTPACKKSSDCLPESPKFECTWYALQASPRGMGLGAFCYMKHPGWAPRPQASFFKVPGRLWSLFVYSFIHRYSSLLVISHRKEGDESEKESVRGREKWYIVFCTPWLAVQLPLTVCASADFCLVKLSQLSQLSHFVSGVWV